MSRTWKDRPSGHSHKWLFVCTLNNGLIVRKCTICPKRRVDQPVRNRRKKRMSHGVLWIDTSKMKHDIIRLRKQGYNWYQIAALLKVSEQRLQDFRSKYRIEQHA